MKFFIFTDLEGVAGVDRFIQTIDDDLELKEPSMKQLAREVNACIEGILSADGHAVIDVWDGHGYGGLHEDDLVHGRYIASDSTPYFDLRGYDAAMFVGQHAMEGTFNAPLSHTYWPENISYYRLNGSFIGEFAARTLVAGDQGVPVIFLSGDDKAAIEAKMFVPGIETAITKLGTGLESAVLLSREEACSRIRSGSANAVKRMADIPPFRGFSAPYRFEARFFKRETAESQMAASLVKNRDAKYLDERTIEIVTDDLSNLPF